MTVADVGMASTDCERPLRILQYIDTGGPGGAEAVFIRLARALADRGHVVETVVDDDTWLADTIRRIGLSVTPISARDGLYVTLLRSLRRHIRQHRFDVVHTHLFGAALYGGLAARMEGVRAIATLHGQNDVPDRGLRLALKRAVFTRVIDRTVAVSETLRRDLRPLLRMTDDEMIVISNGVPFTDAAQLTGRRVEKRRSIAPHLVAIGNIRRPKDYPTLFAAVRLLQSTFPDVRLSIAGHVEDAALMAELQALVNASSLRESVTFLGYVENPLPLLVAADCFVLASVREGFSLATIEAMLAGTPVVATRCGGPEEILHDGTTGRLVPVASPVALAATITEVLRSDRTDLMVETARVDAGRRFGMTAMVDAYEALYRDVVGPSARS